MNREILFRGFTSDENGTEKVFVNGEWIKGKWVEGFLFKTQEHTYIAYVEQFDDDLFLSPKNIFVKVLPETVGQYTGLPDKNGKKIFEGDICKHRSNYSGNFVISVVTYTDGQFLAMTDNNRGFNLSDNLEIIGNIHDNPELLEGEAE